MSRDSYEILHEQIHGWLHRKNIASSVRRVSTLPVAIATDIGLVRKENQDRVAILKFRPSSKTKDMVVVALADGMGGMEGGANAASLTVSTFFTELIRNSHLPIRANLELAVLKANDAVLNIYKGNGGATLSAIALEDSENITAVNVGDSRIYSLTRDEIIQLSEDDTLAVLAKKYQHLDGTETADINSRLGGELVQFVGINSVLEIHYLHINPFEGGMIVLSSDGAHSIGKDNLKKLFEHSANVGVYSRRIIDLASWFGGFDNASVAVVDVFNMLKEIDLSSGYVINLWDPFGELKVISVPDNSYPAQISGNFENKKSESHSVKNKNSSERGAISSNDNINKKNSIRKRSRPKNKIKSLGDLELEKKELNGNDELENVSQLDMPFSEKNLLKGNDDEK